MHHISIHTCKPKPYRGTCHPEDKPSTKDPAGVAAIAKPQLLPIPAGAPQTSSMLMALLLLCVALTAHAVALTPGFVIDTRGAPQGLLVFDREDKFLLRLFVLQTLPH